jgi:hypothetical protein
MPLWSIIEYLWLAPSVGAGWWALRTRLARTVSKIIRVEAWDHRLRAKGVSANERRKLLTDLARRDLEQDSGRSSPRRS